MADLPPGVDAVAVLDRPGERLWSDPAGATIRAALSETGLFTQTQHAWAGLATALGYAQDEAATALLGRRVIIVWEDLAAQAAPGALGAAARAETRWAVMAEIDRETATSLRTHLGATPRRTVAGRVIYSIDAGRVAMALTEAGGETRVLIAPNAGIGLLESWLSSAGAVRRTEDSMGVQTKAVLGNVEPGWVAVAAIRVPGAEQPTGIELRTAGGAWGLRFAMRSEEPHTPTGVPMGVLNQIEGDPLLAAAFSGGPRFGESSLDLGIRIGARGTEGPDDAPLRAGQGVVLVVRSQEPSTQNMPSPTVQFITHSVTDTGFAEQADRMISRMIGGEHPPHHRGAFPHAVRTHTTPALAGAEAKQGWSLWAGRPTRVAWCLGPDQADRSGVISMAIAPEGADPSSRALEGRQAWDRGGNDHDQAMITAGTARPADLAALFDPDGTWALSGLAAGVERMHWTARLLDGTVRAEVLLRLKPIPSRPRKP